MHAYRRETVVDSQGAVIVRDLPLRAGETVEVIILVRETGAEASDGAALPSEEPRIPRRAGSAKGMITLAPDFDAPLADFRDYTA